MFAVANFQIDAAAIGVGMALRFRRRIRMMPGVHVNIGKRGLSVSAGVRGALSGHSRIADQCPLPGGNLLQNSH